MLERATRDEREKDVVREAADPRENRLRLLPHRTLSAIYHPLSSDSLGPTNLLCCIFNYSLFVERFSNLDT